MKKFTFLIVVLLISGAMFAQQTKFASIPAVKSSSEVKVSFENQGGAKVDTDTLFNFDLETAAATVYGFGPDVWGFWTGQNQYGFTKCAETFTTPAAGDLNGFVYAAAKAYDAGGNSVTFKVWDDNAGVPGTELASQTVNLADIATTGLNDVTFASPVSIDGTFYIGYEVEYNTPVDTFAMAQTQTSPNNTFIFEVDQGSGPAWNDMPTLTQGGIPGSNLIIGARVNITFSDPLAEVNPSTWAAGGVETGSSATSGTITLTNAGAGTLTVTSVTDLSGTPFSTTFVEGDVSLATDATYDFTFDFNPTAEGTFNETFEIVTNGGTVTVDLSGTGNAPISGDMDGGFETNVNDFDLTFSGWTQHDEDGSTTYSIQGATFTNQGYTGSFIAFNPTNTEPAQTWVPNTGSRAGVCFAATTPPNNDWLITPQSDVLNAGAKFQAYVQSITDQYGLERYAIWVSTTSTDIASFTKISAGEYVEAPIDAWTMVEYSLEDYVGEQVYVAIQCVSNDAFYFMIDDIVIDNPVSVANDIDAAVAVYPNPANNVLTIENAQGSDVSVFNMLGQELLRTDVKDNMQTLNVSELPEGSYIVRIANGTEIKTQKLNIVR